MDIFDRHPPDLATMFLGIIDYEETKLIGWLEDAIGPDIGAVELQDPLEFKCVMKGGGIIYVDYLFPETGIPQKVVHSTDCLAIHSLTSAIGKTYLTTLKNFRSVATRTKYEIGAIYDRNPPTK